MGNWLKANWIWVALGVGTYFLLKGKGSLIGGNVQLPTSAYKTGPGGELQGEDIDVLKGLAMMQAQQEIGDGILYVYPSKSGGVMLKFKLDDGKEMLRTFPSVASALTAAQSNKAWA